MTSNGTHFTVLLAGHVTATGRLKRQVGGSRAIAADGGMMHAKALGLVPEIWLGDFDSSSEDLVDRYPEIHRRHYPEAKDATDGELAVQMAVENGARHIVLAGGLGGQADHAFAHLMLLLRIEKSGIGIMASSGEEEAWPLLAGEHLFDLPPETRLSILPVSDIEGLDLEGVRWPLRSSDVPLGSTLTLSNEVTSQPVKIRIRRGQAILLAYPCGD